MNETEMRALDREMGVIALNWDSNGPELPSTWCPTEDIRQAMMVVEALGARGWEFEGHRYTDGSVLAMFREDLGPFSRVTATEMAMPLAICLAAKQATESER